MNFRNISVILEVSDSTGIGKIDSFIRFQVNRISNFFVDHTESQTVGNDLSRK